MDRERGQCLCIRIRASLSLGVHNAVQSICGGYIRLHDHRRRLLLRSEEIQYALLRDEV